MASEGGEILRLKKEALAAIRTGGLSSEMKPAAEAAGASGKNHEMKPAAEAAGAGGKNKKKKVMKTKVPQAHIDCLKEGLYTVDEIPQDHLATLSLDFRDMYAGKRVVAEKIAAYQRALLDQYYAKGFAEDETEVSDEEELVEAAN